MPKRNPRERAPDKPGPGRPRGKLTQLQKVTKLQQLLLQHPRGVTIDEIAKQLQVDPRSARRYVKALQTDLRTELEPVTDGGGARRWRIPDVDVPRRVAVRRTQAYALLAARPLFAAMRGSTVYEEIALAADTLLGIARRPGRGPNAGLLGLELEQRFRYVPFAPKDYASRSEDLDTLFHGVADLRPVTLSYPGPDGNVARSTVDPYALVLYKESIYALVRDRTTDTVRTLELDFVRDSRLVEDERFDLPAEFSVDDYAQGQFGLWRSEDTPRKVVVDFAASIAVPIAARTFHPSQRAEVLPDGGLRLHFELGDLRELTAWLMGFGDLAVVREPPDLRATVVAALESALARYRHGAAEDRDERGTERPPVTRGARRPRRP